MTDSESIHISTDDPKKYLLLRAKYSIICCIFILIYTIRSTGVYSQPSLSVIQPAVDQGEKKFHKVPESKTPVCHMWATIFIAFTLY